MHFADFRAAWTANGDKLCTFSMTALSAAALPESTKLFLSEAGLPNDAAPCLSFGDHYRNMHLGDRADEYFGIGSDGAGNPLVLDENGTVRLLDHDDAFAATYVNSDIAKLAETLLAYRQTIGDAEMVVGSDNFDGEIPAALRKRFRAVLQQLDPQCLAPNSLWAGEAQTAD